MRIALAACLVACGDNAPECGYVELLSHERNIWPAQIAVDDSYVYYSDYDNGVGLHLLFRQPRDGGEERVFASRSRADSFGYGMAVDARNLYWAAELDIGYTLFATPVTGGSTIDIGVISGCVARGVAFDPVNVYAGAVRCEDIAARVLAFPQDGSPSRELWSSLTADVGALAADGTNVWIATTEGLLKVTPTATELADGHFTHHVQVDGDEVYYSTQEQILALPVAGGTPRVAYTFRTPVNETRAFAVHAGDLYVAEPPHMVYVPAGGEPRDEVNDIGRVVTNIVADERAAYWSALALPNTVGFPGSFSGGVLRLARPCATSR